MANTTNRFENYAGTALSALPAEILEEIAETNIDLQENVKEMVFRFVEEDIRDMLNQFHNSIDYEIGSWGYNYIDVDENNYSKFLSDFIKANENMCYFSDAAIDLAQKLIERSRYFDNHYWEMSDKNQIALSEWLENGIETLTDEMLKFCRNEYEYADSDEAVKENLELWIDNGYADDYLVDEEGEIYREIPAYREYL